jgi:hypothetical protein
MDDIKYEDEKCKFDIGDIVTEKLYIIPPDRSAWTGIIIDINKDRFEQMTYSGIFEYMVTIRWFQGDYIEQLPASVIEIVQKVKNSDLPPEEE